MIMPKDERQAKKLLAELAPATPTSQELDAQARKKTMGQYMLTAEQFDRVLGNIQKFRVMLFKKDLTAKRPETLKNLQLPQGQCK